MIYFLRKVPWLVPEFSGEAYRDRLRELHERIEANGVFRARSTRTRLVARKPS